MEVRVSEPFVVTAARFSAALLFRVMLLAPVLARATFPVKLLPLLDRLIEPAVAVSVESPVTATEVLTAWVMLPAVTSVMFPPTETFPRPRLRLFRRAASPTAVIVTVPLKALPVLESVMLLALRRVVLAAMMPVPVACVRSPEAVSDSGPVTLTAPMARSPL